MPPTTIRNGRTVSNTPDYFVLIQTTVTPGQALTPLTAPVLDKPGRIVTIETSVLDPADTANTTSTNARVNLKAWVAAQLAVDDKPKTSNVALPLDLFGGSATFPMHCDIPVMKQSQIRLSLASLLSVNAGVPLLVSIKFGIASDEP